MRHIKCELLLHGGFTILNINLPNLMCQQAKGPLIGYLHIFKLQVILKKDFQLHTPSNLFSLIMSYSLLRLSTRCSSRSECGSAGSSRATLSVDPKLSSHDTS